MNSNNNSSGANGAYGSSGGGGVGYQVGQNNSTSAPPPSQGLVGNNPAAILLHTPSLQYGTSNSTGMAGGAGSGGGPLQMYGMSPPPLQDGFALYNNNGSLNNMPHMSGNMTMPQVGYGVGSAAASSSMGSMGSMGGMSMGYSANMAIGSHPGDSNPYSNYGSDSGSNNGSGGSGGLIHGSTSTQHSHFMPGSGALHMTGGAGYHGAGFGSGPMSGQQQQQPPPPPPPKGLPPKVLYDGKNDVFVGTISNKTTLSSDMSSSSGSGSGSKSNVTEILLTTPAILKEVQIVARDRKVPIAGGAFLDGKTSSHSSSSSSGGGGGGGKIQLQISARDYKTKCKVSESLIETIHDSSGNVKLAFPPAFATCIVDYIAIGGDFEELTIVVQGEKMENLSEVSLFPELDLDASPDYTASDYDLSSASAQRAFTLFSTVSENFVERMGKMHLYNSFDFVESCGEAKHYFLSAKSKMSVFFMSDFIGNVFSYDDVAFMALPMDQKVAHLRAVSGSLLSCWQSSMEELEPSDTGSISDLDEEAIASFSTLLIKCMDCMRTDVGLFPGYDSSSIGDRDKKNSDFFEFSNIVLQNCYLLLLNPITSRILVNCNVITMLSYLARQQPLLPTNTLFLIAHCMQAVLLQYESCLIFMEPPAVYFNENNEPYSVDYSGYQTLLFLCGNMKALSKPAKICRQVLNYCSFVDSCVQLFLQSNVIYSQVDSLTAQITQLGDHLKVPADETVTNVFYKELPIEMVTAIKATAVATTQLLASIDGAMKVLVDCLKATVKNIDLSPAQLLRIATEIFPQNTSAMSHENDMIDIDFILVHGLPQDNDSTGRDGAALHSSSSKCSMKGEGSLSIAVLNVLNYTKVMSSVLSIIQFLEIAKEFSSLIENDFEIHRTIDSSILVTKERINSFFSFLFSCEGSELLCGLCSFEISVLRKVFSLRDHPSSAHHYEEFLYKTSSSSTSSSSLSATNSVCNLSSLGWTMAYTSSVIHNLSTMIPHLASMSLHIASRSIEDLQTAFYNSQFQVAFGNIIEIIALSPGYSAFNRVFSLYFAKTFIELGHSAAMLLMTLDGDVIETLQSNPLSSSYTVITFVSFTKAVIQLFLAAFASDDHVVYSRLLLSLFDRLEGAKMLLPNLMSNEWLESHLMSEDAFYLASSTIYFKAALNDSKILSSLSSSYSSSSSSRGDLFALLKRTLYSNTDTPRKTSLTLAEILHISNHFKCIASSSSSASTDLLNLTSCLMANNIFFSDVSRGWVDVITFSENLVGYIRGSLIMEGIAGESNQASLFKDIILTKIAVDCDTNSSSNISSDNLMNINDAVGGENSSANTNTAATSSGGDVADIGSSDMPTTSSSSSSSAVVAAVVESGTIDKASTLDKAVDNDDSETLFCLIKSLYRTISFWFAYLNEACARGGRLSSPIVNKQLFDFVFEAYSISSSVIGLRRTGAVGGVARAVSLVCHSIIDLYLPPSGVWAKGGCKGLVQRLLRKAIESPRLLESNLALLNEIISKFQSAAVSRVTSSSSSSSSNNSSMPSYAFDTVKMGSDEVFMSQNPDFDVRHTGRASSVYKASLLDVFFNKCFESSSNSNSNSNSSSGGERGGGGSSKADIYESLCSGKNYDLNDLLQLAFVSSSGALQASAARTIQMLSAINSDLGTSAIRVVIESLCKGIKSFQTMRQDFQKFSSNGVCNAPFDSDYILSHTSRLLISLDTILMDVNSCLLFANQGGVAVLFDVMKVGNLDLSTLSLQCLTTIYRRLIEAACLIQTKLQDGGVDFNNILEEVSVTDPLLLLFSGIRKLMENIAVAFTIVLPGIVRQHIDSPQWDFIAQCAVLLSILPTNHAHGFVRAFTTGPIAIEVLAAKLWQAMDESFQQLVETSNIRKNIGAIKDPLPEMLGYRGQDNCEEKIAAAHMSLSAACFSLCSLLRVIFSATVYRVVPVLSLINACRGAPEGFRNRQPNSQEVYNSFKLIKEVIKRMRAALKIWVSLHNHARSVNIFQSIEGLQQQTPQLAMPTRHFLSSRTDLFNAGYHSSFPINSFQTKNRTQFATLDEDFDIRTNIISRSLEILLGISRNCQRVGERISEKQPLIKELPPADYQEVFSNTNFWSFVESPFRSSRVVAGEKDSQSKLFMDAWYSSVLTSVDLTHSVEKTRADIMHSILRRDLVLGDETHIGIFDRVNCLQLSVGGALTKFGEEEFDAIKVGRKRRQEVAKAAEAALSVVVETPEVATVVSNPISNPNPNPIPSFISTPSLLPSGYPNAFSMNVNQNQTFSQQYSNPNPIPISNPNPTMVNPSLFQYNPGITGSNSAVVAPASNNFNSIPQSQPQPQHSFHQRSGFVPKLECQFFFGAGCAKGEDCTFAHYRLTNGSISSGSQELTGSIISPHNSSNPYSNPNSNLSLSANPNPNLNLNSIASKARKAFVPKLECQFFFGAGCSRGEDCTFAHYRLNQDNTASTTPNPNPNNAFNSTGANLVKKSRFTN